ncbi:6-phosphogluconolactonase [Algoriphagus marinus]|uniref:6-phosphogluconolactonase n=1 Tax=Algoriphagus marinus TaxID=1925762 RepID=UPI00094B7F86|nr:6-phosphogluconolactonase [Algoriphagus marinus]
MNLHYCKNYEEMSQLGAELVLGEVENNPDLLFCAASGNSPSGLYQRMVQKHEESHGFFDWMRVIKLDEWVGLPVDSPFTSEHDVQEKLVKKLGIGADRYIAFDAHTNDPQKECDRIQDELEDLGPIDICILGVGINGHLALNEPADHLQTYCHVAKLSETTLSSGMIEKVGVPLSEGMTMGMGNIFESKKIIVFFTGKGKKPALEKFVTKEITSQLPVSMLWLHPNTHVIIDEASMK